MTFGIVEGKRRWNEGIRGKQGARKCLPAPPGSGGGGGEKAVIDKRK